MESLTLEEGMKAPDFTLVGSDKKEHKLSDYLNKKSSCTFTLKTILLGVRKKHKILKML